MTPVGQRFLMIYSGVLTAVFHDWFTGV